MSDDGDFDIATDDLADVPIVDWNGPNVKHYSTVPKEDPAELRERVARAIFEAEWHLATQPPQWEKQGPKAQETYRALADAAITAMRGEQ